MLDFQEQSLSFGFVDQIPEINFSFDFDSIVRHVFVVVRGFDLYYSDGDHHISRLQIEPCLYNHRPFSKTVTGFVIITMQDNNPWRPNNGIVRLLAIADREPTWIQLRSEANAQYVCAENGGGGDVIANRLKSDIWETFSLEGPLVYGERVSFKTFDGIHYLQVQEDGSNAFTARGYWPKTWETFTIIPVDPESNMGDRIQGNARIALKTEIGTFVSVDSVSKKLNAAATSVSPNETFTVRLL
jgi:hypothetical protein